MIIVTVIELLVERALYRTLARIRKICSGGVSPETSPTHSSPATRLPLEVVEMIIAYLAYDKRSLFACTLTCRSWYIAAVRYVHRTLTVNINSWDQKFKWKNRIMHMCMSSLFPLVKKFQILGDRDNSDRLSPKLFNHCILYQFSALTNVLDLRIECLDIPKFIPRIKRYFRNFLPTVRSLSLKEPNGSRRQIIYFIGLFQHLQDLELLYDRFGSRDGPADDPTLTPPFAPPLRGWLVMKHVRGVGLLEGMIDLFGGLRFRYIRLRDVDRMPFLLAACAETLEVVVLNPADPRGEKISLEGMKASSQQFRSQVLPSGL